MEAMMKTKTPVKTQLGQHLLRLLRTWCFANDERMDWWAPEESPDPLIRFTGSFDHSSLPKDFTPRTALLIACENGEHDDEIPLWIRQVKPLPRSKMLRVAEELARAEGVESPRLA